MDMDNRVGIDCGLGVGRAGESNWENWDNCNRTTIKKKRVKGDAWKVCTGDK